jgi:pimeloyl-ACP methyl ester carboxylesterase
MRRFILCILLVWISSKVTAEELTWGSNTTYAPMPVLFIHGINANSLTWDTATKELEKYFGYRWKRLGEERWITNDGLAVTHDRDDEDASQNKVVKHYLEAFDYGGKDRKGSIKPLNSHKGQNWGQTSKAELT